MIRKAALWCRFPYHTAIVLNVSFYAFMKDSVKLFSD